MSNKILIVEDEFIVANDLRLILEQAGYTVTGMAASVEEAEQLLQKDKPDMVIVDIRLKGKRSGIDLARTLKADQIGFIYLSANSNQKILEEAKITEPYGFLIKPFREKELLVALDIAAYRHKHSLESKLRQEEGLQKRLIAISTEKVGFSKKVGKLAGIMQLQIPFDLIAWSSPGRTKEHDGYAGYLRTGFEEYQLIGEEDWAHMTGRKKAADSLKTGLPFTSVSILYAGETRKEKQDGRPALTAVFDALKMQSCLVCPLKLDSGKQVTWFFYSRHRNKYNDDHITLVNRLNEPLKKVSETKLEEESLSGRFANDQPATPTTLYASHGSNNFNTIVGNHPLLLEALDLAVQVAPYNTSVLILGESGTGKEKVAESLHLLSSRKSGPFIKINCAAIPLALIESELFGHEKGSFTGAIEKRKGKFEQADGGTIFLDEIGDLPLEMQVKLLRVLQEREIQLIGGNAPVKINVRIVAATNRNLEKEVAEGRFRLDLYYRLNVFPITLPALRERKTDIEALTLYFTNSFCKEFNKPFTGIAPAMLEELVTYNWPGNIRELENVVEQAVILNDGTRPLTLKRNLILSEKIATGQTINTLEQVKEMQNDTERTYILSVLKKTSGRVRGPGGAAELMNIKPTTLESKMAKLHITKEEAK